MRRSQHLPHCATLQVQAVPRHRRPALRPLQRHRQAGLRRPRDWLSHRTDVSSLHSSAAWPVPWASLFSCTSEPCSALLARLLCRMLFPERERSHARPWPTPASWPPRMSTNCEPPTRLPLQPPNVYHGKAARHTPCARYIHIPLCSAFPNTRPLHCGPLPCLFCAGHPNAPCPVWNH